MGIWTGRKQKNEQAKELKKWEQEPEIKRTAPVGGVFSEDKTDAYTRSLPM